MATSKLKPGAAPEAAPSDTQLANRTGAALAAYEADRNNYDSPSRDTIIPKIGLVNATGPLAKKFRANYGEFVFEERVVLGKEVPIIALKLHKYYVECRRGGVDLKFEDEKKIFPTANDAHQAGYAIDWDSKHTDKVEEAATITMLVAGPADDASGAFFIPAAGLFFAPAVMSVRRGGYRDVYRKLYTAQGRAAMRKGFLYDTLFLLTSENCSSERVENEWVEPRVNPKAKLTPEDVAGLQEVARSHGA